MSTAVLREFLRGAVRLHILHHASQHEIYGAWMSEELAEHGYRISSGTLYPTLHRMESEGLLASRDVVVEGRTRRSYKATPVGSIRRARPSSSSGSARVAPEATKASAANSNKTLAGNVLRAVMPRTHLACEFVQEVPGGVQHRRLHDRPRSQFAFCCRWHLLSRAGDFVRGHRGAAGCSGVP